MRAVIYTGVGALAGILGGHSLANPPTWLVWFYWVLFGTFLAALGVWEFRQYLKSKESARREQDRQVAERAKEWAQARIDRRTRERLEEFWNSPMGQDLKDKPFVRRESVRIVSIGQDDPIRTFVSRLTYKLNEHEVVHIEIGPPPRS